MKTIKIIDLFNKIANGEIYDVILDNKESNCYVIIDDDGLNKVVNKDLFEKVGE